MHRWERFLEKIRENPKNVRFEQLISLLKYFGFAIITTLENIGIQFLLTNFVGTPLEISMVVALTIGYLTKFLLDRKYVFIIE